MEGWWSWIRLRLALLLIWALGSGLGFARLYAVVLPEMLALEEAELLLVNWEVGRLVVAVLGVVQELRGFRERMRPLRPLPSLPSSSKGVWRCDTTSASRFPTGAATQPTCKLPASS